MEENDRPVPKWVNVFLWLAAATLVYCFVIHAIPGYMMATLLGLVVAYGGAASYYLAKAKKYNVIAAVWIVIAMFVATFWFNHFVVK